MTTPCHLCGEPMQVNLFDEWQCMACDVEQQAENVRFEVTSDNSSNEWVCANCGTDLEQTLFGDWECMVCNASEVTGRNA